MLIIEGRIEANVGKEELIFESGSFTYFGLQVLMQLIEEPFTPTAGAGPFFMFGSGLDQSIEVP